MRTKRFLSFLMTLVMLAGMITPLATLSVFAAEEEEEKVDYLKEVYETPEDKLHTMGEPVYTNGDMEMYYLPDTGEVMIKNKVSGQILSTNPTGVGSITAADTVKTKLLSQLILTYKDSANYEHVFDSYTYAALNGQITMKKIKGGIRVEYAIGNSQKKKLVPRYITVERFESMIKEPMEEADPAALTRLMAFYQKKDANDPTINARTKAEILATYPITAKKAIYVIAPDIKPYELDVCEGRIMKYTNYTLEDMLADHDECNYVLEDDSPPLFKMSLEYYLNKDGVSVNLPARGITYDTAKYKLINLQILPYFGTGASTETGYSFIPDGSGAIVNFADVKDTASTISANLYGNDYGFYQVTGGNMQTWKYPVYGIVYGRDITELEFKEVPVFDPGEPDGIEKDEEGNPIYKTERTELSKKENVQQGYFAIIEEGDSLSRLSNENGGTLHPYSSSYITVFPRQSDSYPLDGITVSGQTATYEVDCERKYVGNFRTRYIMLYENNANYVGMANTYRDYLKATGVFGEMTGKDGEDLTMYLEVFGDVDTTEKFLGMPVEVKTPLTTFENAQVMLGLLQGKVENQTAADTVKEIYPSEFEDDEVATVEKAQKVLDKYMKVYGGAVDKLALKYTGWYNGGMWHTPPSKLDVDGVLGGDEGLKNLVKYLGDNSIEFYPDLEFSYVKWTGFFDNFDMDTDTAKTVDGKPAWNKSYSYIFQSLGVNRGKDFVLLSSTVLEKYYNNIKDKFLGFNTSGVSLGSLGTALNSSQDEDDPVNREEAKQQILDLMKNFSDEEKNILVNGGNQYTLQYADVVLNAPIDSNNRVLCSHEIPFVGMVLHGYVEFSGEAINLAGDAEYNILKTIENGATPYFVLSFENTSELKASGFTQYYAIQFDIWYDEVIQYYNDLNKTLKKVAGSVVTDHQFVADRVVKVTYSNGVSFLLNYNNAEVTVDGTTLAAMAYAVV